jgi:hypothetical protein
MAIAQAFPVAGKVAILEAWLAGAALKMALYRSATASLGAATTGYTATGETSGTGYSAGGKAVTGAQILTVGAAAVLDFDDPSWTGATFSAEGALLYDDARPGKPAVAVLDFGGTVTAVGATFTVIVPPPTEGRGIVRIG